MNFNKQKNLNSHSQTWFIGPTFPFGKLLSNPIDIDLYHLILVPVSMALPSSASC